MMSERELLMQAIAKVERHEGKDLYYNSHNQAELMVAIAKFLLNPVGCQDARIEEPEKLDGYKHRTTAYLKLIEELEAQVKYWEDKEVDRAVCCSSMQDALELIAAPKRPDGTYNRSREACELLAKETLERLEEK